MYVQYVLLSVMHCRRDSSVDDSFHCIFAAVMVFVVCFVGLIAVCSLLNCENSFAFFCWLADEVARCCSILDLGRRSCYATVQLRTYST